MHDYLKAFANRHNLGKQLNATSIILESKKALPDDLTPVSYRSGVLNIEAESHSARSFYEPKKEDLRQQINQALKQDLIKNLKFRIKS